MMGSVGKVISGLESLAEIAKAISDPVRLQTLRDEFTKIHENHTEAEQKAKDQHTKAKTVEDGNQKKSSELSTKEVELATRERVVAEREENSRLGSEDLKKSQSKLKADLDELQKAKYSFSELQNQTVAAFILTQKKHEEDLSKRESTLTKRENTVFSREQSVTVKEAALVKQSQFASAFVQSLK